MFNIRYENFFQSQEQAIDESQLYSSLSNYDEPETNESKEPIEEQIIKDFSNISNINLSSIKIANWNLRVFGVLKSNNIDLMKNYTLILKDYDIIFIQEIKDINSTSFEKLCSMLKNYSCKISSRAGRTDSKEQYGIIYKKPIKIIYFYDYNPDSFNRWERPPIRVTFNISDYYLTIFNIHTKPSDVVNELTHLEEIIILQNYSEFNKHTMIIGDLNADCDYYDNNEQQQFDDWIWLIDDNQDTTSTETNCAYDRIIINNEVGKNYVNDGIYSYLVTPELSDHYLIWTELNIKEK